MKGLYLAINIGLGAKDCCCVGRDLLLVTLYPDCNSARTDTTGTHLGSDWLDVQPGSPPGRADELRLTETV